MSEQTFGTLSSTPSTADKGRTGDGGPTLDWVLLLVGLFEAGFSSLSLFFALSLYLLSLPPSSLILATDDDMKIISKILAKNRLFLLFRHSILHNEITFHITEELRSFKPSSIENRARSSFFESPDILSFVFLLERPRLVRPRLYRNSRSIVLVFLSRHYFNYWLDRILTLVTSKRFWRGRFYMKPRRVGKYR